MAKTKQFTIAVDHQPGAVARIAKTLGDAKVNILCLLGTSQGTAGTIQLTWLPKAARKPLLFARWKLPQKQPLQPRSRNSPAKATGRTQRGEESFRLWRKGFFLHYPLEVIS